MSIKRGIALVLLTVTVIPTFVSAQPQDLSIEVRPSEVIAAPNEAVNFTLILTNPTDSDVTVRGMVLRVVSERIFFLPAKLDFGEYEFPWEKPVEVPAHETVTVQRVVRVPNLDLVAGRFSIEVAAATDSGSAGSAWVNLTLGYSAKSAALAILAIAVLLILAYALIKVLLKRMSKARRREKRLLKAEKLVSERERIEDLKVRLEKRFREGRISKGEYERIGREYAHRLDGINALLAREAEVIRGEIERLTRRAEEVRGEIERLTTKAAVGEIKGADARKAVSKLKKQLEEIENEIRRHNKVLREIGRG